MTLALLVVLAAAHLEDAYLGKPALRQDRGRHGGSAHQRGSNPNVSALANGQDLINDDLLADLRDDPLNLDLLASGDPVLLPTGFNDRVHISPFKFGSQHPSIRVLDP